MYRCAKQTIYGIGSYRVGPQLQMGLDPRYMFTYLYGVDKTRMDSLQMGIHVLLFDLILNRDI
jgi:hypothetical protein